MCHSLQVFPCPQVSCPCSRHPHRENHGGCNRLVGHMRWTQKKTSAEKKFSKCPKGGQACCGTAAGEPAFWKKEQGAEAKVHCSASQVGIGVKPEVRVGGGCLNNATIYKPQKQQLARVVFQCLHFLCLAVVGTWPSSRDYVVASQGMATESTPSL